MHGRNPPLKGVLTAIPTAFNRAGEIDRAAVARLVERLIAAGTGGIVPIGGTGEYTALSLQQRCAMVEATVEACARRVPVVAGVLAPGLADAIVAATEFARVGADAVMVVTPYYYRPTQQGIVDYYRLLADRVDSDIVLYEIPYRTGVALTPDTVSELARLTRVIGIKACNQDLGQQLAVVQAVGNDIAILSGEEDVFPLHVAMGAAGGILATSAVLPRIWNEIFRLARQGDLERALSMHARITPAIAALFAEPNPAPLKAVLNRLDEFPDEILPPLRRCSDALARQLEAILAPLRELDDSLRAGSTIGAYQALRQSSAVS